MQKHIISDTSCLILLDKIGSLDLLQKLFGEVTTTKEVADEYGKSLPEWIEITSAINTNYQTILASMVDKGEASAIALALETNDALLIVDDFKARKLAHQLGITITGTLGILIEAKQAGILSSIKPLLTKIGQTNFRISPELEKRALILANE